MLLWVKLFSNNIIFIPFFYCDFFKNFINELLNYNDHKLGVIINTCLFSEESYRRGKKTMDLRYCRHAVTVFVLLGRARGREDGTLREMRRD